MNVNVLTVTSGDDAPIPLQFRSPDDNVLDISAFTDIDFTVKDEDGRELMNKTLSGGTIIFTTDGTDGRADVYLLQDDTFNMEGKYTYDIQIQRAGRVITAVNSFLIVKKDINERIL